MIRLKELFEKVYNWQDNTKFSEQKLFTFEIESGETYLVEFNLSIFGNYYKYAKGESKQIINSFIERNGKTFNDELYEVSFKKYVKGGSIYGTFDIHKTDNAIKVFSTILDIIESNIKPTESFCFTAKESSRVKLYDHLAKKFKRANDDFLRIDLYGNEIYYFFIPKPR